MAEQFCRAPGAVVAVASTQTAPQSRVSEIEKGSRVPNLETILRLALALDCKVSTLMAVFDFDKEDC